MEYENLEELEKAAHYWKDKDPAKYKAMLSKLKRERKTPGHKERAQQQVLQAKRRERGGKGTTAGQNGKSGHSSGHMKGNQGAPVKRYQSSEKKAGTKLSPDRKDNNKGYAAGNVRNIPQKLNRGRHKADEKKVKDWKKKLKKHNISVEDFTLLLRAKALQNGREDLEKALRYLDLDLIFNNAEPEQPSRKSRLEKTGISEDDFVTLLRARAIDNGQDELEKSLRLLELDKLLDFLETSSE